MSNAPDTRLDKVVRVGGGRCWWLSPGFVGSAGANGVPSGGSESADAVWRAPSAPVTTALAPAWATRTIDAQPARDRLTVAAVTDALSGVLPFGAAWIYTPGNGTHPVRVARVEGTTIHLVDRLPYDLTIASGARLQAGLWYVDLADASPANIATRTATTNSPIPYSVTWPVLQAAAGSGNGGAVASALVRHEGLLSVVRQPFDTGLTTDGVFARFPDLARYAQAGSQGLEAAIWSSREALILRIRGDIRQAGPSPFGFEDDLDGGAFTAAHAAMAAAALVEPTDADRYDRLLKMADRLYASALGSAWVDANRDGVVDAGESPGGTGFAAAGAVLPSIVPDAAPWWTLGERR